VLLLAFGQLLVEFVLAYMIQYIIDGCDTHFDARVTFPQQLDGILFYHDRFLLKL
jgi:hypothetical protein